MINDNNNNNRIMLGGGGSGPPHPPRAPLERLYLSVVLMDDVARGGAVPPHPPYWLAFGRREILERFAIRSPDLNNNLRELPARPLILEMRA